MKLKQPLIGERIAIRNYARSDLDFCTDVWFDPENGKYLSDPVREYVDGIYQRALDGMQDNEDGYYLIVELKDTGERIGTCCVFPDGDGKVYDIGYCIHKSRWRQGFGAEMVNLLVGWVREQGGTAVTAEAAQENRASCALLEKCGFTAIKETSFKKYHMDIAFDSFIYEKRL